MNALAAADRVEVLVLVDNVTDNLSSVPDGVETELSRFWRRGARLMAGSSLCCAAHGLSCAVTVQRGEVTRTLLFDTGPDAEVFQRNADRLGFDLGCIDGLMLSHGHWDHAGAMLRALDLAQLRNGGRAVPTYMHPGMYRRRAMRRPDGALLPFDEVPDARTLEHHGARVVHATQAQVVLDDLFFISGEIPRVTAFEQGLPGQVRRRDDDRGDDSDVSGWEPDPLLMDERFLAVRVQGRGLLVLTACSHAGVVNVLTHARACFPGEPLLGVLGGLHLAGSTEVAIPATVDALRAFDLKTIAAGHCTGWRALNALAGAFGDAVVPSTVGKTYRFERAG